MRTLKPLLSIALAGALFIAPPATRAQSPAAPPVAPVKPVTDTYFGHQVVDPYRWMEKNDDPAFQAWMKGQNGYTRGVLAKIPGRDALFARIKALDHAGYTVGDLQLAGKYVFYMKSTPTSENSRLCVREGIHGKERILVDPEKMTKGGTHYSIDYTAPSFDGKYVVYGLSPGGSEESVLHVMETATGRELSERIDRTEYGGIGWRPDGRSFYYNRLKKLPKNAAVDEKYKDSRIFLHVLGTDAEKDPLIFGRGLAPHIAMTPVDTPFIQTTPASPYVFAYVVRGVQNEIQVYAAPLSAMSGAATRWRKVADFADDVTNFDARGDTIFLLTHRDASRYKLVSKRLAHLDRPAHVVMPTGKSVITTFALAQDGVYVKEMDGGPSRLRRMDFSGGHSRLLALPYDGAITAMATAWDRDGLLFMETGWTRSALWYAYDARTGAIADTHLKPKSPVDFSDYTSIEAHANSKDGTLVPLSIIMKRGLVLDGSHPTEMDGYGAYGISSEPGFDPLRLPWLERGGVVAVAHVRGGGEYGEDWHLAGMKLTKQHTIDDFLACAQYLIDYKYTSPARLAGAGASAGGICIGRSITERPDLFAAALIQVGCSNPLRAELSPNGPPNIPEFGSFTTADGFAGLFAMDPYLHVKDGVRYPAVLLSTGINDPRVAVWEPAKMTARLQAATASGKPILLRVDYDAGHGIGSTKLQDDEQLTDEAAFLFWQMGDPDFQPKS
jgi:prolyl oligopeptidase